ncbi:hypothetical protein [Flavobacterium sp. LB2P53]|uniref:hypothetical protein n=2 Tax=unclassified Flavobacterium TaxID=196869 RepID=UPI000F83D217|nr:hypothetical protein [Flavobacterium sp. LB2P53]RTY65518.1 hypothetical protein EKL95_12610 [Flavobacterium sp. LB2P53]
MVLILLSCCEDLYEENIDSSIGKATITEMKFEELLAKDSKFKDLVEKVGGNLITKKNAFKKQNDFIITNDNVKKIKLNNIISYTMAIKRNNATDNLSFENLVIQEEINTNSRAYILKYIPNNIILSEGQLLNFEGEIQMNRLEKAPKFNNNKPQNRTTESECFVYVEQLWCSAPYQGSTQHHLPGTSCQVSTLYIRTVKVLTPDACGSTGGGTSGSTGSDGGFGDPYGTGGGGGYDNSDYPTKDTYTENYQQYITIPILTAENSFDIKNTVIFNNSLSFQQQQWAIDNPNSYNQIIQYQIDNKWSDESKEFSLQIITPLSGDSSLKIDIESSFKSPMNIDCSSIPYDTTKPENQKFNELFDALKTSAEFKKLFLDIFHDSKRFNVKFEIVDRVYEDNDTSKPEANATTSEDPVTKNLTIKISKQLLIAGTTRSQTNIENAKTILHECIHAYLFSKAANPTVGANFVTILNTMYPTPNEQHDFMYGKMIPTMQKVLGEIRDLVTTGPKRTILEAYTMHPTTNPMTSTSFNWLDFYKYISLSGLNETSCFKVDFPKDTDAQSLLNQYINAGKIELDR